MDKSLICEIAKDCINNGIPYFQFLELDSFLLENCNPQLMRDIASWGFVRGRMTAHLNPVHPVHPGYDMIVEAELRFYKDDTVCFEDGDACMTDLENRDDIIVKIYQGDNLLFSSQGNDCSFFQDKVGWLEFSSLEDSLRKNDRKYFADFKSDALKIIEVAELF